MIIRILFFSLSMIVSYSTAAALPPKPDLCPSIELVKRKGASVAEHIFTKNAFIVGHEDDYSLKEVWNFFMLVIQAENDELAIQKGNELVQMVSGTPRPKLDPQGGYMWVCEYDIPGGYVAIAVPEDEEMSFSKIRHLISKKYR